MTGRYLVLEITPALADDAMTLANKHTFRAYDAVQLAAAIIADKDWTDAGLGGFVFVSADRKLNAAATAEGLTVENPENHA